MNPIEISPALVGIVPVVVAVTQIVKGFVDVSRFAPVVAIALGIVGAYALGVHDIGGACLQGFLIGLSASGLYSGSSKLING